jgi:hypothetical protein
MELIDRIDRRPALITFGRRGGSTAAPSVLRDAGRLAAAWPSADRSGSPVLGRAAGIGKDGGAADLPADANGLAGAAPRAVAAAGRPEDAGLTGCTTGFEIGSAKLARESVVPVPAPLPALILAPAGAVS